MVPPMASMLVLTTSMPTPRPETFVTDCAVENPGRKISWRMSADDIWASWVAVRRPTAWAFSAIRSASMPAPSSQTSTTTWPPSW